MKNKIKDTWMFIVLKMIGTFAVGTIVFLIITYILTYFYPIKIDMKII